MSKERFLELLNLYLDDEIQNEELNELFEAIELKEEYRRTYNDYCKMTAACSMMGLADVQSTSAPISEPSRQRFKLPQLIYAFGGMAAAIALVGLAARNLTPIFQNSEEPVFLAPVAKQIPTEQVLGPENVQIVASASDNWPTNTEDYQYRVSTLVSDNNSGDLSWRDGLQLNLLTSEESLSHELHLAAENNHSSDLLSKVKLTPNGGFMSYLDARKEPTRLSVSAFGNSTVTAPQSTSEIVPVSSSNR